MNFQRVDVSRAPAPQPRTPETYVRRLSPRISHVRIPAPERLYLLLALMISGTVTAPQVVDLGGISGLGLWTIVAAGITWGLWLMKPRAPMSMLPAVIPLAAFTVVAGISPLWGGGFNVGAIQLLAVTFGFLGFIVLTARESAERPYFTEAILNALDFASVTAAFLYTATLLLYGIGGEMTIGGRPVFLARPFALFAIIAVARQLARFHAGQRIGMVIALWLTLLVFLSQSRLGMVTILAMYPLSYALLGGRKNISLAVLMLIVGVGSLTTLILASDEMYQRFFGYDASLEVGGVAINASGRTAAWSALINNINSPLRLFFGAGAGAGSAFCQANFANLPHPHNDYIRYLFDFGVVGLVWFLAFMVIAARMIWNRIRAARLARNANAFGLSYTTLLALAGVMTSMFTDNSANYIYIMAPLGILIGATLCPTVANPGDRGPDLDWVFTDMPIAAEQPVIREPQRSRRALPSPK